MQRVNQLHTALTSACFLKSSMKCFKYLSIVIPFLCKSLIGKFSRKRKLFLKYLNVLCKIKGIHQIYLSVGEPWLYSLLQELQDILDGKKKKKKKGKTVIKKSRWIWCFLYYSTDKSLKCAEKRKNYWILRLKMLYHKLNALTSPLLIILIDVPCNGTKASQPHVMLHITQDHLLLGNPAQFLHRLWKYFSYLRLNQTLQPIRALDELCGHTRAGSWQPTCFLSAWENTA